MTTRGMRVIRTAGSMIYKFGARAGDQSIYLARRSKDYRFASVNNPNMVFQGNHREKASWQ